MIHDDGVHGDGNFLQSILNAMPHPVFVMERDMRISSYNRAAGRLFLELSEDAVLQKSGDALKCLHAKESPEGCGNSEACKNCDIRNSVSRALDDSKVYRSRVKLKTLSTGLPVVTHLLITAAPFSYDGGSHILLTLEDINDLIDLSNFVPICAKCKNIRNDENYWVRLEQYFKDRLNLDFSHAICPDCSKLLYPTLHEDD